MSTIQRMCPRLVVEGAAKAIEFYTAALGAKEIKRFTDDGGAIVHAELELGPYVIMVKDADQYDPAPGQLGGSPAKAPSPGRDASRESAPSVIMSLEVDDVDALGRRMTEAGAAVVFPIADQEYGERAGRLRDPYGHLWILSQP
ncbi:MAG: VOC family protein [Micromonosporaceae bacterium]|nr:VOC family protein [Micromonosporaceae bacterium]